jgi:hypothetical protein
MEGRLNTRTDDRPLDRRMEEIAWGVFLMMLGGIWLVPEALVPRGTWLIGAGVIMLALNVARYLSELKISLFTVVVGATAVAAGAANMAGIELPALAIGLIFIGAYVTLRALTERSRPAHA